MSELTPSINKPLVPYQDLHEVRTSLLRAYEASNCNNGVDPENLLTMVVDLSEAIVNALNSVDLKIDTVKQLVQISGNKQQMARKALSKAEVNASYIQLLLERIEILEAKVGSNC